MSLVKGRRVKTCGIKLLETMIEKTLFEVEVHTMNTSSSESLTHDKVRKKIVPSQKNNYVGLGCYALNVVEGLQNSKTETFKQAFESNEIQIWLNNYAFCLVRLPKQEKSDWEQMDVSGEIKVQG